MVLRKRVPSKELRETRIRWHNLGTTTNQVAKVCACVAKRKQWLGEEMYRVWTYEVEGARPRGRL